MEPDFPCLADEIVEPRPSMNIKVAAFAVSEKSINIIFVVVVFVFNVPSTAKVIWRRGHGLKSHWTDW